MWRPHNITYRHHDAARETPSDAQSQAECFLRYASCRRREWHSHHNSWCCCCCCCCWTCEHQSETVNLTVSSWVVDDTHCQRASAAWPTISSFIICIAHTVLYVCDWRTDGRAGWVMMSSPLYVKFLAEWTMLPWAVSQWVASTQTLFCHGANCCQSVDHSCCQQLAYHGQLLLGPFYGAIAVPSVTRCRCCRCCCRCGHRFYSCRTPPEL